MFFCAYQQNESVPRETARNLVYNFSSFTWNSNSTPCEPFALASGVNGMLLGTARPDASAFGSEGRNLVTSRSGGKPLARIFDTTSSFNELQIVTNLLGPTLWRAQLQTLDHALANFAAVTRRWNGGEPDLRQTQVRLTNYTHVPPVSSLPTPV